VIVLGEEIFNFLPCVDIIQPLASGRVSYETVRFAVRASISAVKRPEMTPTV
jgi:hypothetical protein